MEHDNERSECHKLSEDESKSRTPHQIIRLKHTIADWCKKIKQQWSQEEGSAEYEKRIFPEQEKYDDSNREQDKRCDDA